MPKPLPSNSMPWPENLIYDFHLPASASPESADAFISSLPTSDRNRQFLRLRYLDNKTYKEIGAAYGVTPAAVRMALKYLWEKADASTATTSATSSPTPSVDEESGADTDATSDVNTASAVESSVAMQSNNDVAPQKKDKKIREELKPIITAIATTTRQRNFVYDSKTRVVLATDNVPKGLRRDSRYIPLPDYYQIKEYDLMQEFAAATAAVSPEKGELLNTALNGLGPFKAFRSTVRDIGLGQVWADFRYQRFAEIAEDWWGREVEPSLASTLPDSISNTGSKMDTRGDAAAQPQTGEQNGGVLIVDPATLNGITLIETIRVLYRRVGPANFEEALDELRDTVCAIAVPVGEA